VQGSATERKSYGKCGLLTEQVVQSGDAWYEVVDLIAN
jgi:hypothetical protein